MFRSSMTAETATCHCNVA